MACRWIVDRITRRVGALGLGAMHACLEKAELAFVSLAASPRWPPMFIIGLPRVGSTLVYQLIVSRFEAAFFCNAAAVMPRSPALVTSLLGAQSILLGRRECFGDDRHWLSAKPSNYPSLAHLDP